jgi:hypothetical protein
MIPLRERSRWELLIFHGLGSSSSEEEFCWTEFILAMLIRILRCWNHRSSLFWQLVSVTDITICCIDWSILPRPFLAIWKILGDVQKDLTELFTSNLPVEQWTRWILTISLTARFTAINFQSGKNLIILSYLLQYEVWNMRSYMS